MKLYTHTGTKVRAFFLLSLILVTALLLTACTSDEPDTVAKEPTTVSASPTNTPVTETVVEEPAPKEPDPQPQPQGPMDLVDTLINRGNFTQLVAAIQSADVEEKLRSAGPYTILAPTDAAFATLSPDILADPDLLFDIVLYHVIEGKLTSADIANQTFMTTLLGDDLAVTIDGSDLRLDDGVVTERDVDATNGVIHVIDTVLIPPSSGLIRIPAGAPVARASLPTLLDAVRSAGRFEILLDGLDAAGLTPELVGAGPFTIFAPTDEAFLQLVGTAPANLIDLLETKPAPFLRHHVIADDLHSFRLIDGSVWPTLNGTPLTISATNNGLTLMSNDGSLSILTSVDIPASNGILHIIDSVVLPSELNTLAAASE